MKKSSFRHVQVVRNKNNNENRWLLLRRNSETKQHDKNLINNSQL